MSRVLLVDEDGDSVQLLRLWLVSAGHETVVCPPGADCVAVAERSGADVAVVPATTAAGAGAMLLRHLVQSVPQLRGLLLGAGSEDTWSGPAVPTPVTGPALLASLAALTRPLDAPQPARSPARASSSRLPLVQAAPAARPSSSSLVLVVDDEDDLREMLVKQLTRLGYRAVPAADGDAALAVVAGGGVHALLLDVDMPGRDGYDVLRALRADPGTAELPVVMLTARTQGSDVATGLGLGADDYVRKPFSLTEVRARLDAALSRARRMHPLLDLREALVPRQPHRGDVLDVASSYRPFAGAAAGGDFHALLASPRGSTFAVLGDVSGHGPSVAALAAHLRTVATNHAVASDGPGALLEAVNASVVATGDGLDGAPTMATMLCLHFDPHAGTVRCASAGHPLPVVVPGGEVSVEAGVPLGVLDAPTYAVTTLRLPRGSQLVLFSDGLSEGRRGGRGEMFGEHALVEAVVRLDPNAAPTDTVASVVDAFTGWVGGDQQDDVTVVALALTDRWVGSDTPDLAGAFC